MSTGSRALPLLCKTTRFLPADVTRLVRECLRVHVGARCPAWIDDLLWNQVRALPWGTYRRITVTFCVSRNIDYGIYRQDETSWGRTSLRPCHMPTRSGLSSSDEHETDDAPVRVEVLMVVDDHICRWLLRCLQGDTELRVCGNLCFMLSVTELLTEIRSRFDGRRAGPSGSMEVPSTWQEWRSFISLWLFGPPAPKQATLAKWLRYRPASDTCELCHDCGKTSAPGMTHSVRKLGGAFCSAQCATAYTVLSCRRCKEPLSADQGLCKACRRGLPRPLTRPE